MARVFPDWDELGTLPTALNVGERQVLECLAALDDEWIIYVQPRLGLDQPDFITAHPRFGVCAVEVKDWSVGAYRQAADGRIEVRRRDAWVRTDEAPRYQAHRYRGAIHERLAAVSDDAPAYSQVRGVVVMPQCTTTQARALLTKSAVNDSEKWVHVFGHDSLEQDPVLVLTGTRQPEGRWHQRTLPRRTPAQPGRAGGAERPAAPPDPQPRGRQHRGEPPRRPNSTRAWICGLRKVARPRGAGGASFPGGEECRSSSRTTRRCRTTCATSRRVVAATSAAASAASRSRTSHDLCRRGIDDAHLAGAHPAINPLPGVLDPWEAKIDQGIEAYRLGYGPRFDAVLVDEGQDFSLKWWNLLRLHVCRPDGELLLVADPTQDLYGKRAWTDEERMIGAGFSGPWTELRGSYRLPPDLTPVIAEFAQLHLSGLDVTPSVPTDHPQQVGRYKPTVKRWVNTSKASRVAAVSVMRSCGYCATTPISRRPTWCSWPTTEKVLSLRGSSPRRGTK